MSSDLPSLPFGWTWAKLGDLVLEAQPGFACGKRDADGYVQLRMNNIGLRGHVVLDSILKVPKSQTNLEKYRLRKGDILFNNTNSPDLIGKTVLFRGELEDCVYSNHISRLRINHDATIPEYMTCFLVREQQLGTFQKICRRFVGQAGISRADLLSLSFPLPPLTEQDRIVSKIEELFQELRSARQALQKIPHFMKQFRQSVLAAAFRGELTQRNPDDEPAEKLIERIRIERNSIVTDGTISQGPWELPDGWSWTRLGEIAQIRKQQINPMKSPEQVFNYLSIENVESDSGRLVGFEPTLGGDIQSTKLTFTPNDILYSKLRPYLNKVHTPKFQGISATDLIPISPEGGIPRDYLAHLLRTGFVVEYANQRMHGIQLPRISVKDLLDIPVPLAPLKEQRRIVARIDGAILNADAIYQAANVALRNINLLEQSILAKAFRGELVPQDPNNEPVSVLLERIKAQRPLTNKTHTKKKSEGSMMTTWIK